MGIEIRGMAPLLQVFDMPSSIAFYRDLLEFEVVSTDRPGEAWDWVLLRRDGVQVMLNTAYEGDARPPPPIRVAWQPTRTPASTSAVREVDAAYDWLRARGLDLPPPEIQSYGMKQLYLTDPDGYKLCFQWPVGPVDEPAAS